MQSQKNFFFNFSDKILLCTFYCSTVACIDRHTLIF